jgi:hypothetical protein
MVLIYRMKLVINADANSNIYPIINVLTIAQHFRRCFDAIEVEVRA